MASFSHCLLFLLCLALVMAMAAATRFRVGGPMGWTVPTDPSTMSYNQWASRNRFQIGDSLLFVYPPDRDSVLQVTPEAYNTCNTTSYIRRFDDGNTVFTLDRSGLFYFISGDENNCLKNESVIVLVMADRSNRGGSTPPPAMPPSLPAEVPPPPAAEVSSPPAAEITPPAPEEIPPPPPPPSAEVPPPSEAPAGDESSAPPPPPPNAASTKVVGFMSSFGALCGSLLVMLF